MTTVGDMIRSSEEATATAQAVSEYLYSLPLTPEQNDRLVALMVAHASACVRCGFEAAASLAAMALDAPGVEH